jgi:GT2 family glycosyltransferase
VKFSVVVPFHRNLSQLEQCLAAIGRAATKLAPGTEMVELLVVADGAVDDPRPLANQANAHVHAIAGPNGPAVARNRGVEIVTGDVVVFVDTDVVVREDALARLAAVFAAEPGIGAAFGAYDHTPADPGFLSQCRNLGHAFIHERSNREAATFWAGLGAVHCEVFRAVGGFDERFPRPSVEDIDLGYRIRAAGHRIVLDPSIQGTHLKRWTFRNSVTTDVRDRGIPWTQLMHRYGGMRNDLNVTFAYRACVVIAYLMAAALVAGWWWPPLFALLPAGLLALWLLDRPYYRFFIARRGLLFTLRWFPFHILHHLCNGVSFGAGTALWLGRRAGVTFPWSLPVTAWTGDTRVVASTTTGTLSETR